MKLSYFSKRFKTKVERLFTKTNRSLLVELIRANIKVRDHNSLFGVLWSLLGPAAMYFIMYFVFATRFGQEIKTYPLYLLVGIVFVSFFIIATTNIIMIFSTKREVILNLALPRENFIVSDSFIHTYKFIIQLIICMGLGILYGVFTWKSLLLLLPLMVAYIAFVLGVVLILSLVFCFVRDIQHIWGIISRLLLFATPVFYSLDTVSPLARRIIYWGNPLTPFLISFQGIFIKMGNINMLTYVHSLMLGAVFFILSYSVFIVLENTALERA